jgi:CheY-like chemotaxis protein
MHTDSEARARGLVLLVDGDDTSRRDIRHLLESRGIDVVQTSNGMAALELIQRLHESLRFVMVDLSLPGLPGSVLIETLRHFRPDLPVLCMTTNRTAVPAGIGRNCLAKPLQTSDLDAALSELGDGRTPQAFLDISPELLERTRRTFTRSRDLVEAALELASGLDGRSG